MKDRLIIKTLFGTDKFKSDIFVITNINVFYRQLLKKYKAVEKTSGWWKRALILCEKRRLEVLKIPPGNNIIDCLKTIKKKAQKLIWLGYGAGFKKNLTIGTVVFPNLKNIYQSDGLIQSKDYYQELLKKGVEYVDMECREVFSFAKGKRSLIYLLVISDLPLKKPFYLIGEKDIKKIKQAVRKAVGLLPNFLIHEK